MKRPIEGVIVHDAVPPDCDPPSAAIAPPVPHQWLAPGEHPNRSEWTCCALCGRIKRADGKPSSSCPGLVKVKLREHDAGGDA